MLVLTISCSGNQTRPRDSGDMTYLDIGSYTLGIDKRFELMGTRERDSEKEIFGNTRGSQLFTREYIFADLSEGADNIYRGVIVYDNELKDPQQFWSTEMSFDNTKAGGKVDSGFVPVGGVKMAYMILSANPTIDQNIMKIVTSGGSESGQRLQVQDRVSMVYFAKLIGRSRNIVIVYVNGKQNAEIAFNESLRFLSLED